MPGKLAARSLFGGSERRLSAAPGCWERRMSP